MKKVIVIGGGPAGMMAAAAASARGAETVLLEKNEKLGKKLYITGKGRCNLTNACAVEDFFSFVCSNPRFLYSSIYAFSNADVVSFFEKRGMKTKTERGQRVFPVSDHSSDVIRTMARALEEAGVRVCLNTQVKDLDIRCGRVCGVKLRDGKILPADAVVVATGGLSYPSTGSTGDGYRFAQQAGHACTKCSPSLVPFNLAEDDAKTMQGLSLRNVTLTVCSGKKVLFREQGEMLFTHFGASGPLVLTASTRIHSELEKHPLVMQIDLKSALDEQQLHRRFLREFEAGANRQLGNVLPALYPSKLIPVILQRSGISGMIRCNEITKAQRAALVALTKCLPFTITSLRDYNEAIITRGGVDVRKIDPGTMESRILPGLYFAGEVLDVDAQTGGFNLQIAWSTGHCAGENAAI